MSNVSLMEKGTNWQVKTKQIAALKVPEWDSTLCQV